MFLLLESITDLTVMAAKHISVAKFYNWFDCRGKHNSAKTFDPPLPNPWLNPRHKKHLVSLYTSTDSHCSHSNTHQVDVYNQSYLLQLQMDRQTMHNYPKFCYAFIWLNYTMKYTWFDGNIFYCANYKTMRNTFRTPYMSISPNKQV